MDGAIGVVVSTVNTGELVSGQTVVVTATTEVMTAVPLAGQLVASGPHWVTV